MQISVQIILEEKRMNNLSYLSAILSEILGEVHKLHWQVFDFFDHLPPWVDIFYLINIDKKSTFLDYLVPTHLLVST